tara:strand:- start:5 stop:229 length:225 start_codon:yes stop_codon:yes gene_type:complete
MFDPCNPTYVGLTFHSTTDASLTIDAQGVIACTIDGVVTDGGDHKDGWEHPVSVYADHVGIDYADILTIVEAHF